MQPNEVHSDRPHDEDKTTIKQRSEVDRQLPCSDITVQQVCVCNTTSYYNIRTTFVLEPEAAEFAIGESFLRQYI